MDGGRETRPPSSYAWLLSFISTLIAAFIAVFATTVVAALIAVRAHDYTP